MIDKHQIFHKAGGLKMIIINTFITSMRGLNNFIPNFISCGIEYVNIFLKTLKNKFWIGVFKAKLNYNIDVQGLMFQQAYLFF